MDAVSAFGNVEDPWDVHCGKCLMGVDRFAQGLAEWRISSEDGKIEDFDG